MNNPIGAISHLLFFTFNPVDTLLQFKFKHWQIHIVFLSVVFLNPYFGDTNDD